MSASPCNCRPKYINLWFSQGCILAAASKLNNRGLLGLIHQQGWLPYKTGDRLAHSLPADTVLGVYLRQQGAITTQQFRSLFQHQVLNTVQTVAELTTADFSFKTLEALPYMTMTGLKLPIYEVQSFLASRAA